MRTNQDHIAAYLALRPTMSSRTLFNQFYGIADSDFHHRNYVNGKVVPVRLNNWCEEQCKELRLARAGIQAVHTNPVQEVAP